MYEAFMQKNGFHGRIKRTVFAFVEAFCTFCIGGGVYYALELLWRGYSHITMFAAGGLCFCILYYGEKKHSGYSPFVRCVGYAYSITGVELAFGLVFNRLLGLHVWDYSDKPLNLWGQICPAYFFLWLLLAFCGMELSRALRWLWGRISTRVQINE